MAVAVGKIRMSSNNGLDLYSIFQPKTGENKIVHTSLAA